MDSKTRALNALLIVVMLLASSGGSASAQTPVGAAFTYQGRLLDSLGAPIAGLCDIDFSLYDEGSGGSQIGTTQTLTNVVMTDGYFSVSLDFGSPAWNGDARWLQVTPTCPPSGVPEIMPRQAVETVPYAVYALNSTSGTTSTVYITNTVYITESFYYTPSYHLQGWDTITGTPGTYTPTYHLQGWATITGTPGTYTVTVPNGAIAYGDISTGILTGSSNLSIIGGPLLYRTTWQPQFSLGYGTTSNLAELDTSIDADGVVTYSIEPPPPGDKAEFRFTKPVTFTQGATASSGKFIDALTNGSTGGFRAGASSDVLLYRSDTNTWRTPDNLIVDGGYFTLHGDSLTANIFADGTNAGLYLGEATTFLGRSADTNYHITGSAVGDLCLRSTSEKKLLLGTGTTLGLTVSDGNIGVGTTAPNDFRLQTVGSIGPDAANTYDLGSASKYWATIHYHTLSSHSLSVFTTTVRLQDGRNVSCLDALAQIKAESSRLTKGNLPHMDYSTIPALAVNPAPFAYNGATLEKKGEDGADLDMMVSLVLCAERELDAKTDSLNQKMADLGARLSALEQKVK